ncbi:hypothetical protein KQX54_004006 [Cotesia glomerata]|uniref:Uncharacterized protein n=1 Tax=Cotesia glomerata TaxID=32391 RepID=A0AAV7IFL2_COTGL|nr:hypothetical protein KQX54_004006 [Cotesia glomerata]
MHWAILFFFLELITSVYSASSESSEEIGERIFGFAETTQGCSRPPKTQKEIIIGETYYLLCRHFDPESRDRIIKAVQMPDYKEKIKDQKKTMELLDYCFTIMKPKFMSCFKYVFDSYDLAGIESPPECLKNLTIFPEANLQFFWLKNFKLVITFIEEVIKGYKIFNPAREIVEKFLEQGIFDRWQKFKLFSYAKIKLAGWNSSRIEDKNKRLHKILEDPPRLIEVCKLSEEWLSRPKDFKANDCLRQIMGNILIIEHLLQQQGLTLESEFMEDQDLLPLHLLHVTKSILAKKESENNSRRSLSHKKKKSPFASTVKLQEIKAMNVKCLDELRERYDKEKIDKLSELLHEGHLRECLDSFVNKTESSGKSTKKLLLKTIHADKQEDVTHAEKKLIKSMMRSYRRMMPLQPAINNIVEQSISGDPLQYPWANDVINKYQESTIPNKYAKLDNAVRSANSFSMSSSTSCKKAPGTRRKSCWSNYIQQNALVENKLRNDGLSLEYVYMGDPFRMNLIYSIDQSLKRHQNGRGRVIGQFRVEINPEELVDDQLLDTLADDQLDVPDDLNNADEGKEGSGDDDDDDDDDDGGGDGTTPNS